MIRSGSVALEHLAFLARANTVVNLRLGEVLAAALEGWERPIGGYFSSVSAILAHIQVADSYWAADIAFSANLPLFATMNASKLPDYDVLRYTDLEDWRRQRVKQDAVLESLVAGLSPQHLDLAVREFESLEKAPGQPVWKALLHVFNHQTHHRGQISAALESFGVTHNFSNLISID